MSSLSSLGVGGLAGGLGGSGSGPAFDRYWQIWQGNTPIGLPPEQHRMLKYDPDSPMPLDRIHKQMSTRLDTYFVEYNGIHYTQTALLAKEIRDADTIYWFADFQDKVEEDVMKEVLRKLGSNRQKLYIHSPVSGRFFEQVKD